MEELFLKADPIVVEELNRINGVLELKRARLKAVVDAGRISEVDMPGSKEELQSGLQKKIVEFLGGLLGKVTFNGNKFTYSNQTELGFKPPFKLTLKFDGENLVGEIQWGDYQK